MKVRLKSTNHADALLIVPRYQSTEQDRRNAVAGFRRVREIVGANPLARMVVCEHEPGDKVSNSEDVLTWVRRRARASSIFHPVGTCKMGPETDKEAVVDSALRVKGIAALRVVDGAIMPHITSGNTNAPITMIAERAADLIRRD